MSWKEKEISSWKPRNCVFCFCILINLRYCLGVCRNAQIMLSSKSELQIWQKQCCSHFRDCILLCLTSKKKELETRGWSHIVEEKKIFFSQTKGIFWKLVYKEGIHTLQEHLRSEIKNHAKTMTEIDFFTGS